MITMKDKIDAAILAKQITRLKDMIDSCFTYGGADVGTYNYEKYILPYGSRMPKDVFDKEYKEYLDYLKKNATVTFNVYTDHEGCTYNQLVINAE